MTEVTFGHPPNASAVENGPGGFKFHDRKPYRVNATDLKFFPKEGCGSMPTAGTKLGSGLIRAYLRREAALLDQREDLGGGFGDVGAGAVDRADAGFFEEIVILGRDDAATDDEDVARALAL